jgi:predicted nucleic acid-binding protein
MILIDTNIILRSKQKGSPHFYEVTEKLVNLIESGEDLVICPQVIYEFYVVATRPIEHNGFGLPLKIAIHEIENLLETYSMPAENDQVFYNWQELIAEYNVIGKNAHDTRIVAFMVSNDINKFYTLNKKDFERFSPIIELV